MILIVSITNIEVNRLKKKLCISFWQLLNKQTSTGITNYGDQAGLRNKYYYH